METTISYRGYVGLHGGYIGIMEREHGNYHNGSSRGIGTNCDAEGHGFLWRLIRDRAGRLAGLGFRV